VSQALYEMPEESLSACSIQALADRVEVEIQGGAAARPLLAVPHLISDEASCYYHGYVCRFASPGAAFAL
jgi:hypothetical protein